MYHTGWRAACMPGAGCFLRGQGQLGGPTRDQSLMVVKISQDVFGKSIGLRREHYLMKALNIQRSSKDPAAASIHLDRQIVLSHPLMPIGQVAASRRPMKK